MDLIDALVSATGHAVGPLLPAGPIRSLAGGRGDRRRGRDGDLRAADRDPLPLHRVDGGHRLHRARRLHHGPGRCGSSACLVGRSSRCSRRSPAPFPGIMATRTIDNRRDRLTTIMIAPFMSCSARLPVYALLIGAFVPHRMGGLHDARRAHPLLAVLPGDPGGGAGGLGTASARCSRRNPPLYVMELPPIPAAVVALGAGHGARARRGCSCAKAGTVILAVSIVLWFLASYPKNQETIRAAGTAAGTGGGSRQPGRASSRSRTRSPAARCASRSPGRLAGCSNR